MEALRWEEAVMLARRVPGWSGGKEERRLKEMWVVWLSGKEPPAELRSSVMALRIILSGSRTRQFELHRMSMARAVLGVGKEHLVPAPSAHPPGTGVEARVGGERSGEGERPPQRRPGRIADAAEIEMQQMWCGVPQPGEQHPEGRGEGGIGGFRIESAEAMAPPNIPCQAHLEHEARRPVHSMPGARSGLVPHRLQRQPRPRSRHDTETELRTK